MKTHLLLTMLAITGLFHAVSAQTKQLLWDFRTDANLSQKFSKGETDAVLKYLFGDKRDSELGISSRFSGAFTKPDAKETLYYVGGCDEDDEFKSIGNCAHVNWWNAGWIAIYDGTTPKLKIKAALGYTIAKLSDVNGDGLSEILSLYSYSNQGATESSATLGQIKNGKYVELNSFRGYSDMCGDDRKSRQFAKAATIKFVPTSNGKMPAVTFEYFQNKCGATPWNKITKKQFEN